MVNNFFRVKVSSNMFFHNKAMFSNTIKSIFIGMVRVINYNIPPIVYSITALPVMIKMPLFPNFSFMVNISNNA